MKSMNWPDKIFLIGMPGSGKSTLGRSLAGELSVDFVDLDAEIEASAGETIKEIFATSGEDHFRSLEATTLSDIINKKNRFIMATGGGTPCFYNSIDLINANGFSIFIDVSVETLHQRLLKTNISDRPKLGDSELIDQLSKTHENRFFYYSQAHLTMSDDNITSTRIREAILNN